MYFKIFYILDQRLLLLGHSRPQHWPRKSAMAYNGDIGNQKNSMANHRLIPLITASTFGDQQRENGHEEWEKSRWLFMDQTEECEDENGGNYFDEFTRHNDPLNECIWEKRSDQIWQKRHPKGNNDTIMSQRRNLANRKDLFETKIDRTLLANGGVGFVEPAGRVENEQNEMKNKKNKCSVIAI